MRFNHLSAGCVAALAAGLIVAVPTTSAVAGTVQSTVVSAVPAVYTPDVTDGTVFAIGQSGSTVVLGGNFTSIAPHGSSATTPAQGLAAFTAGTGALVSGFVPTQDGTVQAIIAGPTPGTVYVGCDCSLIDGVKTKLALISTTTGAIVPGWKSVRISGGPVNSLVLKGGQLFVAGNFTLVNGLTYDGLVVMNPTTGAVLPVTVPTFTGHHNFGRTCFPPSTCANAPPGIKSMDISPDGTRLVAVGNFTSVGGSARDQIAMLDLSASAATVDPTWATLAFTAPCAARAFDTYMRAVQFSPDGSYFAVVTTGGSGTGNNSDGTVPSCDAASRYETSGTGTNVRPTWIDYTGRDTFLSLAVTSTAIYAGGHERWLNNSQGSDSAKEGAVPRPGIVAMDPINGMPLAWNPGRDPRGVGTEALLATSDGLYVGSDTDYIGPTQYLHKKIAFFPLAGGQTLASNATGTLPGNIVLVGSGTSSSTARSVQWDGSSTPGAPSTLTAVDWSTARGAFEVNNEVYYGSTDGNFYQRSYDGTTFGPAVAIDPYDDPVWSNILSGSGGTYRGVKSNFYGEMSSLTSMFYSGGRVYYTLSGRSQMFWRWFEPDSGVMGADEFTTTGGQNFSHVSGAFLSGSTLYFADSSSHSLFTVPFVAGQPSGTPTLASSSMDWTSHGAFITVAPQAAPNKPPTASFSATCSALTCSFDASASHDPDGTIASYTWSWGDNTANEQDATPTTTHTYAGAGSDQVMLTVTDNSGASTSTTRTVTPTTTVTVPITFQGVSNYDGNQAKGTVAIPSAAKTGDQLLLFESIASPTITGTVPAGWTLVGSLGKKNLSTAVYARTAQAGDAGTNVVVPFTGVVKASLTIGDYAGAVGGVESEASASDATTSSHTSPALNGLSNGSMAVTFWTDKSTGTTSWTPPAGVTQRSAVFGAGGGTVSALLADSGTPVSGSYGGLTATTNAVSGSGAEWTIALAGS